MEVNIEDLPGNTEKDRERRDRDRPRVGPQVRRENVVRTKKTFAERFVDYFSSEDMFEEVVMPAIGNMLMDGIEIFFFRRNRWENRGRRYRYDDDYYRDEYDYNARYKSESYGRDRDRGRRYKNDDYDRREEEVDYRHIVLKYREDAEKIVKAMRRQIRDDDEASVADLLSAAHLPGEYTDNDWGWTDPRDIDYKRVSNGYLILVTEPRSLRY